jgi:leucyl/phenylalanyl-tRNA--protein transferase
MTAESSGLLMEEAGLVDATLSVYARGWFPMYEADTDMVHWVQPRQRGLIPLEEGRFRISRSLRSAVRSGRFEVTCDRAFDAVIEACASERPGRTTTWLDPSIAELFRTLHRHGHAHSVEAWRNTPQGPVLVGGLYGLAVGAAFCGESMFSRPEDGGTDASKVCLVHLVAHLRRRGFSMLDAQMHNPHLEQFGCFELDQGEFAERLWAAAAVAAPWGPWEPLAPAELSRREALA